MSTFLFPIATPFRDCSKPLKQISVENAYVIRVKGSFIDSSMFYMSKVSHDSMPALSAQKSFFLRCVGVSQFILHVLQLLLITFTTELVLH